MKSSKISFNVRPLITIVSLLVICLTSSVHAQVLSQLTNGATRGAGSLDSTFKNLKDYPIGLDSTGVALNARFIGSPQIFAATVQTDGRILIGGNFEIQQQGVRYRNFQGITVIWRNLARLNSDGTLDITFISESVGTLIENGNFDNSPTSRPLRWGPDGAVHTISAELNEDSYQYIIAGDFLNFSHNNLGFSAPRLRYLVLDALPDDPATEEGRFPEPRIQLANDRALVDGFNAPVRKIRRISGGGIVPQVTVPSQTARLALTPVQAPIGTIVLQLDANQYFRRLTDGAEVGDWFLLSGVFTPPTYYVMGDFTQVFDNETQPYIVRATRNGGLARDPAWTAAPGPNGRVNDIAVSAGENIIIGEFTDVGGTVPTLSRIAKIDDTGAVDATFDPGTGFDANAYAIALDPLLLNVVIAGEFTDYDGNTVGRICRLDLDGNYDASYPVANYGNSDGANGVIRTISRQPDGRILIAGSFTRYNGIPRSGIARLEADGSLDESFTPRGDASGVLAFATDINGGPGTASLFARPVVVGNFTNLYGTGFKGVARLFGGSFPGIWYQPAEIEPANQVAVAGGDTTFNVVASDNRVGYPGYPVPAMPFSPSQASSEPLRYQWQFNGRDIQGANQSTLELTDLEYSQAGTYRVVIYNSQYYIFSQTVELSVLNPFIGVIPASGLTVQGRIEGDAGLNSGLGGNITMTISRLGSASGTLVMAGGPGGKLAKYKFAGQFGFSGGLGVLEISIPRKNLTPLTLRLEMDISGAPTDFEFTNGLSEISDGINTAVITAWNNRWSNSNSASAFAGKYNVGLETDAGDLVDTIVTGPITRAKVSQGHGYFTMYIASSTGTARIAGVLSDGSKFTTTSFLWGDTPATLPIWAPIYKYKGALQGELNITNPANLVTADLDWTKPSGLKKTTDAFGFDDVLLTASVGSGRYSASAFTASLPGFNLTFDDGIWTTANGGLSAPPLVQSFTIAGTKVTADLPNPNNFKIKLNTSSGLVTGGFTDADVFGGARKAKFQSIILNQGGAESLRGYFILPNAKKASFYIGGSVEGY